MKKNQKLKLAIDFIADYLTDNQVETEKESKLYNILKKPLNKNINNIRNNSIDLPEKLTGLNPEVISRAQEINNKVIERDANHYKEIENDIIKNLNEKVRNLEGKSSEHISDLMEIIKGFKDISNKKITGATLDDNGNPVLVEVKPLRNN